MIASRVVVYQQIHPLDEETNQFMQKAESLKKMLRDLRQTIWFLAKDSEDVLQKYCHVLQEEILEQPTGLTVRQRRSLEEMYRSFLWNMFLIIKELLQKAELFPLEIELEKQALEPLGLSTIMDRMDLLEYENRFLQEDSIAVGNPIENTSLCLFWFMKWMKILEDIKMAQLIQKQQTERKRTVTKQQMEMVWQQFQSMNEVFLHCENQHLSLSAFQKQKEEMSSQDASICALWKKIETYGIWEDLLALERLDEMQAQFYKVQENLTRLLLMQLMHLRKQRSTPHCRCWGVAEDVRLRHCTEKNLAIYVNLPGYCQPLLVPLPKTLQEEVKAVFFDLPKYDGFYIKLQQEANLRLTDVKLLFRLHPNQIFAFQDIRKEHSIQVKKMRADFKKLPEGKEKERARKHLQKEEEKLELMRYMFAMTQNDYKLYEYEIKWVQQQEREIKL